MTNPLTTLDTVGGLRVSEMCTTVALVTVTLSIVGCERPEPEIDAASVERVVTTLSADEMLGRAPFTPAIDGAAAFIQAEFESIGLDVLENTDAYLQRFPAYRLELRSTRVILNGIDIPGERTTALAGAPSFRWTTGDPVEVVVIGPDENPGQRIFSLRFPEEAGEPRLEKRNTLVLMSTSHQAFFRRWADGLTGPEFFLDPPSAATLVCALTDEAHATSYEVEVIAPLEQVVLTNVVGVLPGRRDDEIVIFGGHYDAKGIVHLVDGDSIANGANDGASGTTGMIELARFFKARGKPERTLIFAAFTAEEIGFLGSEFLARQIDPARVVAMFSIAAIGKVDPHGANTAYITGFDRSDFGTILQNAAQGTRYSFYPDPYVGQYLFRRSDNAPFARLGVPAHAISTISMNPRDEHIHTVADEVETLDLANMTSVIRAIALGATPIISGAATPMRIDPPLRP